MKLQRFVECRKWAEDALVLQGRRLPLSHTEDRISAHTIMGFLNTRLSEILFRQAYATIHEVCGDDVISCRRHVSLNPYEYAYLVVSIPDKMRLGLVETPGLPGVAVHTTLCLLKRERSLVMLARQIKHKLCAGQSSAIESGVALASRMANLTTRLRDQLNAELESRSGDRQG